jgi:hypothetical protein
MFLFLRTGIFTVSQSVVWVSALADVSSWKYGGLESRHEGKGTQESW